MEIHRDYSHDRKGRWLKFPHYIWDIGNGNELELMSESVRGVICALELDVFL